MDPNARWDEQYADDGIAAQLLMLVTAAQVAAARDADVYVAAVLAELAVDPAATPGIIVPSAFSGVAGDGRPVESLLALAVPRAGRTFLDLQNAALPASEELERPEWMSDTTWESLNRERSDRLRADFERNRERAAEQALVLAGRWLETAAATAVIDAARAAESAASMASESVEGYVRMLNPPSCSRCAVLAGRFYRWNEGFERHPLCDCRHIPVSESIAGDLTVNPNTYFDSLEAADQDRIFTIAGANAIRDGADIGQVVNARRGMQRAQDGAHAGLLITREGITRRGAANRRRTGRNAVVRLMPETIYDLADGDRAEAMRLLRLNGFLAA
ncbi:hypothetical protein FBY23_5204 [Nocardioides sp. SLBN-35]|nr:hypothetical protein FBY23_5204 [Nocardioides sp. SLBN-35]